MPVEPMRRDGNLERAGDRVMLQVEIDARDARLPRRFFPARLGHGKTRGVQVGDQRRRSVAWLAHGIGQTDGDRPRPPVRQKIFVKTVPCGIVEREVRAVDRKRPGEWMKGEVRVDRRRNPVKTGVALDSYAVAGEVEG